MTGFAPLHTAVKRPENREAIDLLVHVRVAALFIVLHYSLLLVLIAASFSRRKTRALSWDRPCRLVR